ncbi:DUF397 domain-containing protein [Streptomyces griseorubiginosus]|uniref:DUF397 domain-containing protein n=1 Tax=Streptomyces griseorubiginosus TaxID=67304 RepID=UPI00332B013E
MTDQTWQKSTYSEEGSAYVEIATAPTATHIRDSKTPTGPHLTLRPAAWADFVRYAAETS